MSSSNSSNGSINTPLLKHVYSYGRHLERLQKKLGESLHQRPRLTTLSKLIEMTDDIIKGLNMYRTLCSEANILNTHLRNEIARSRSSFRLIHANLLKRKKI